MPPARTRLGGPLLRLTLVVLVLLLVAAAWGLRTLGTRLHHEDPLARADVIFVLGGTHLERAAEAGDLFHEGWAPRILLSRPMSDGAEAVLTARGLEIPSVSDIQRQALVQMSVPARAIDVVGEEQASTASESRDLRARAVAEGWTRVIVVTSKLHTARAALVLRRHVAGTGVEIIMRASRYDEADVDRWWERRADARFAIFEAQKLVFYWLGVAD